ncbi:CoA transferase [Lichenibacterium dinghuense]|uniref:CoA transferase n=1 Tax=Lichenibacterium dinghuense TaxID=2895977 RepID=UPI001F31706E|nr:CoA transferase [Lichenibacterium sp. 6Y81]
MDAEMSVATEAWAALGGAPDAHDALSFAGEGAFASAFAVDGLAAGSVAAAGLALADLLSASGAARPSVAVDRRLAALWFGTSILPDGWALPPARHPTMRDYRARDGWIKLHTVAPAHRAAAARVLGAPPEPEAFAAAVAGWSAEALERAVVEAGGCAAAMRSEAAWLQHPQGRAVAAEPLVALDEADPGPAPAWAVPAARPLAGVRVLDLTRVLAGPVATRLLAGWGAEVLRIDPPGWEEDGLAPDVTLGKSCARLDLREGRDRATFEALLARADVLLNGYRPGAMDALGYGVENCRRLSPGLVDVRLDAWGWTGPWAGRRGFDSLVQMASGINEAGARAAGRDAPLPLPVQALDHATGYLAAAAALRGLARRVRGQGTAARLSLAATARLLSGLGPVTPGPGHAPPAEADLSPAVEHTVWGPARRLRPPLAVEGAPLRWDRPANPLGSAPAAWW